MSSPASRTTDVARTPDPTMPSRMRRRDAGRVIAGVAGGVADHLGVEVFVVRVAFVALAALAGAGVMAYGLLWFFVPVGDDTVPARRGERLQAYGLAVVGVVAVAVVGFVAAGTPVQYLVPLVVVAVGATVVWREVDAPRTAPRAPALTWTRIGGGAVLVVAGLVFVVLAGTSSVGGLNFTLLAVGATLLGVLLLTVPLWMRLLRTIDAERAARIRTAEREEIAAHLHDSVLQTLALIQKRADRPEAVAQLARGQERELRRWLFGDAARSDSSLAAAMAAVGADVEDGYGIEVDVVTVGDAAPSTVAEAQKRWEALLGATREAIVNAAKHSGQRRVDLYAEVGQTRIEVFVRDRGHGFDPDAVADDRHGVDRSIRGRLRRHGGTATIRSTSERGTEVAMSIPWFDDGGAPSADAGDVGAEEGS